MALIDELKKLVGNASDAAADLDVYAKDMSLCPAGSADAVVWPASTEEVSAVVEEPTTEVQEEETTKGQGVFSEKRKRRLDNLETLKKQNLTYLTFGLLQRMTLI